MISSRAARITAVEMRHFEKYPLNNVPQWLKNGTAYFLFFLFFLYLYLHCKSLKSAPHKVTPLIVICPTSYPPTCVFSLLYLFGFCSLFLWPWHGRCCECWVGSFIGPFFLFTSFHAIEREGSGAICLIGSFSLQCCDRASVISSHIAQDGRSLALSTMRTENLKWKSGPVLVLQEMRLL